MNIQSLDDFKKELEARYGTIPLFNFISVEDLYCMGITPVYVGRAFKLNDGKDGKKFNILVMSKPSCKRCYGFGYVGMFYSNEERFRGMPTLSLCSCLKVKERIEVDMDGNEVVKAQAALPKVEARNLREVSPSGEISSQSDIQAAIANNILGELNG